MGNKPFRTARIRFEVYHRREIKRKLSALPVAKSFRVSAVGAVRKSNFDNLTLAALNNGVGSSVSLVVFKLFSICVCLCGISLISFDNFFFSYIIIQACERKSSGSVR